MALMMDPEAGEHGGNGYAYNPCHPPSSPRSMDGTEAFSSDHPLPASILLAPRSKGPSDSLRRTTMSKEAICSQERSNESKMEHPSALFVAKKGRESEPCQEPGPVARGARHTTGETGKVPRQSAATR